MSGRRATAAETSIVEDKYSRLDLTWWSTGAGWSRAYFRVGDHVEDLAVTHIFDNPNEVIARATAELVEGATRATFTWCDEPGAFVFDLERADQSPRLDGRFRQFPGSGPRVWETEQPATAISFTTHLEYWATLVHASLSRVTLLSKHSLYTSWNSDVPAPEREFGAIEAFLKRTAHRSLHQSSRA